MSKNKKIDKKKKSALPLYAAAIVWILRAFDGTKMYKLSAVFATALFSFIVYSITSAIFGKRSEQPESASEEKTPAAPPPRAEMTETEKMLAEGRNVLAEIRKTSAGLPNAELSSTVLRIEQTATKIIYHISQNPEKAPQIRKFLTYYLPTVQKLLGNYNKLWLQNTEGQNISSAMREIEAVMYKMDDAFEKQLDSLFGDVALDVSTDISVLDTMLKQEGLLEDKEGMSQNTSKEF